MLKKITEFIQRDKVEEKESLVENKVVALLIQTMGNDAISEILKETICNFETQQEDTDCTYDQILMVKYATRNLSTQIVKRIESYEHANECGICGDFVKSVRNTMEKHGLLE